MAIRLQQQKLLKNLRYMARTLNSASPTSISAVSPLNTGEKTEPTVEKRSLNRLNSSVLDINDHVKLFSQLSTTKLLRAALNLHLAGVEPVVNIGIWVMNSRLMEIDLARAVVMGIIRHSFYEHFCAGESASQVKVCVKKVNEAGLRGMLGYAVEHTDDVSECEQNLQGFLESVQSAKSLPPDSASFVMVKLTAICPMSLLKRVSDLLRWQQRDPSFNLPWKLNNFPIFSDCSPLYHTLQKPEPLTLQEENELQLCHQRLQRLCQECLEANVPLAVDAEDTIVRPAIDYLTYNAAILNNKDGKPIVCNTIQAYLKDAKERLFLATKAAEKMGVPMGFKLVRGAYMSSESKIAASLGCDSPIHDSIQETHTCYNDCASYMLEKIADGSGAVILATHNVESVQLAAAKATDLGIKGNQKLEFAQLYGMAEALSFGLRNAGFKVSKCVPYGPVDKIIPYLLRRAEENRGFLAASNLDRQLMRNLFETKLSKRLSEKKMNTEDIFVDCTNQFITDQIFESRDALILWAKNIGREHGYVIVIKCSDSGTASKKARLQLACDRSGIYRGTNTKGTTASGRKGTGTKKCGCPFLLSGIKLPIDDSWCVKVVSGFHNHSPAKHLEGHSYLSRLSEEENILLANMTSNMIKPKNILMAMKQNNEDNVAILRTIYNAQYKHRLLEKAGRSQMQQLMKKLNECEYVEWHTKDKSTDCVKDLFWAHPAALNLLNAFPDVLIMDCTYKTNRYRLPLLEIVGVTSTNLTFSVAFVYMESERIDNYIWALTKLRSVMSADRLPNVIVTDRDLALMKAIETVFPSAYNLLCRWHISKNVLANCKKLFDQKETWKAFYSDWNVLVFSSNVDDYLRNLVSMERDYRCYPRAVQYVEQSWLVPYKERFVAAWTDRILHFGNVTTNRAESAHAKLKRHLGSSRGNFETSWEVINSLLELQHTEIKASFEKSVSVVEHNLNKWMFKELRGLVSRFALNLIFMEAERSAEFEPETEQQNCHCVIRSTYGLPCVHTIRDFIQNGDPISLNSVHLHWKTLEMKSASETGSSQTCIIYELDALHRQFNQLDEVGRITFKQKLREFAFPSTTSLLPPVDKVKTKGRPRLQADTSTKRDPSYFEFVQSAEDSSSQLTEIPTGSSKQKIKPKYISAFPKQIRRFIFDVIDVMPDGHCGFRSVAGQLGMGEEGWAQVRSDLIDELQQHYGEYVHLYGSIDRVADLLYSLSCFDCNAPADRWMTLPDMGHLIASRYNVVLIHLSLRQCLTYLPLRTVSPPQAHHTVISIGFVNDCHFVQVNFDHSLAIPPVACNWYRHRHECAHLWVTPYVDRITYFMSMIATNPNVATREIINVDES